MVFGPNGLFGATINIRESAEIVTLIESITRTFTGRQHPYETRCEKTTALSCAS